MSERYISIDLAIEGVVVGNPWGSSLPFFTMAIIKGISA